MRGRGWVSEGKERMGTEQSREGGRERQREERIGRERIVKGGGEGRNGESRSMLHLDHFPEM